MGRRSHNGTPATQRNLNKPKVDLYKHSIKVILSNQLPNGAYPASPSYETYRYCWFRDGAYNAYAMDVVGHADSAKNFYNWALNLIVSKRDRIEAAITQAASTRKVPSPENLIDARYHPADGSAGTEENWGNFQLDGLGTLMWAVSEYMKRHGGDLPRSWREGISLLARYLEALWKLPCYDCWEEDHDKLHVSTLVAIYGGLFSASGLLSERRFAAEAAEVKQYVLTHGLTPSGALAKHIGGDEEVDAALVHAAVPYKMLDVHDPIMLKTVEAIEKLRHGEDGGVHRYEKDTFYGGGEWVLLTSYLGWYYVHAGKHSKASDLMRWVECCARENGDLPEQVSDYLNADHMLDHWESKWGEVACPLLWSHGAYLTLHAHMAAVTAAPSPAPSAISASSLLESLSIASHAQQPAASTSFAALIDQQAPAAASANPQAAAV